MVLPPQIDYVRRGMQMAEITIKDIAKECGVGISTVSRAINNHPDINPETRKMILEVIAERKEHQQIILPAELVVRDSTGPCAG